MLIRRCAWHRSYHGYPLAFGIASWRGLSLSFTDGMCLRCSARLRREWNLAPLPAAVDRYGLGGELVRVAAMMVMAVSLLLAARPLDELTIHRAAVKPPQTVLVPSAPVEEVAASPAVKRVVRTPAVVSISTVVSISRPLAAPYLAVTDVHTLMEPLHDASRWDIPAGTMFAAVPHAGLMQQTP